MSYKKRHSRHTTHYKVSGLKVEVRNDNVDKALKKFTRKVQDAGIIKQVKDKQHFEKPSEKKQRNKKQARKRWLKKLNSMQPPKSKLR